MCNYCGILFFKKICIQYCLLATNETTARLIIKICYSCYFSLLSSSFSAYFLFCFKLKYLCGCQFKLIPSLLWFYAGDLTEIDVDNVKQFEVPSTASINIFSEIMYHSFVVFIFH